MSFIRIKLGDFNGVIDTTIIDYASLIEEKATKTAKLKIFLKDPEDGILIDFDEIDVPKAEALLDSLAPITLNISQVCGPSIPIVEEAIINGRRFRKLPNGGYLSID